MIWNIEEMICKISEAWTLAPGDIIFTGTPAGVALSQGFRPEADIVLASFGK